MGTMDDRKLQQRDRKSAAKQERIRKQSERRESPADWAAADPYALQMAVCAVAARGGALRLGYTRDGGAYAIGIYGDGDPYTEYVKPGEDLDGYLRNLADEFGI